MSTVQFDALARAHRDAQRRLHALADDLSDEQFNWKPEEGRWSVGEVVAHLNTMARGYLPVLEQRLSGQIEPLGDRSLHHGWVARKFIQVISPGGRPMPTTSRMAPPAASGGRSSLSKPNLLADFDDYTDRFVALVEQSDGKAIDRVKVRSPFLRVLRLSGAAFLDALGQHSLRHVDQAQRVAQQPAFPDR
jgi:hypothetical protein